MTVRLANHQVCRTEHLFYLYTARAAKVACFTNDLNEAKTFARKYAQFGKPLPIFNRETREYVEA